MFVAAVVPCQSVLGGCLNGRTTAAAGVPERQKLHLPRNLYDSVIQVVVNPGEVHASDTNERCVPSPGADPRLNGDE